MISVVLIMCADELVKPSFAEAPLRRTRVFAEKLTAYHGDPVLVQGVHVILRYTYRQQGATRNKTRTGNDPDRASIPSSMFIFIQDNIMTVGR